MHHQLKLRHLPIYMEMEKDTSELHSRPQIYRGDEHCNFC